eukprot:TRINITY_DN4169_c0_g1_i1.p1 TRINITY_DN4169_c0_g1~~TRINITY_DN4169_c0_g1_i1.p1  ORF type:complete len:240 (+),score=19.63 TRINITY_DN4169_c0_g1_i1:68-721(+)
MRGLAAAGPLAALAALASATYGTSAPSGFHCEPPNQSRCLAVPDRSSDDLGYALSVVCGSGVIDCGPINPNGTKFYPNSIYHHCNWAFNAYWGQPSGAECGPPGIPPGKAARFCCSQYSQKGCRQCELRSNTSNATLYGSIGWLCTVLDPRTCDRLKPGGDSYHLPLVDKASLLAAMWWHDIACNLGDRACDFNGAGHVVNCNESRHPYDPVTRTYR